MDLVIKDLSRRIGGRTLFDGLSFTVRPGQILVVRGPSGVGKSQLLRQLAGLDPRQGGEITLDGRTPEAWGLPAWRAEVTYVNQHPPTGPDTPAELLQAIGQLAAQRTRAGGSAQEIATRWAIPVALWDRPWSELSGGERLRLSLAIALSRRPAVLLLDEPTGPLDPATTRLVEADLRAHTAVWVTHDPAQARRVGAQLLDLS